MEKEEYPDESEFEKLEEMILEEEKKSKMIKTLVCPVCNSTDIMYYLGAHIGYMYSCKKCGYTGAFILEK